MYTLGIYDSSFGSAAAVLEDGKIISAIEEERLNRIKHSGGFPLLSIPKVLEIAGIKIKDIDSVAMGNTTGHFLRTLLQLRGRDNVQYNPLLSGKDRIVLRLHKKYLSIVDNNTYCNKIDSAFCNRLHSHLLKKIGITKAPRRYDHHLCHAANAFYASGFDKCLAITADARGDNEITASVNICDKNGIRKIADSSIDASLGHLYGAVTELLGFRYNSDEGKTEALAAFGEKSPAYAKLVKYIKVDGLMLTGKTGKYQRLLSTKLKSDLIGFKREDIAYAAQKLLEDTLCKLIEKAIEQTGIRKVVLSGGIFYNVKLNNFLSEISGLKDLFIFPAAGDNGIAIGAAYLDQASSITIKPKRIDNMYLGTEYSNSQIKQAFDKLGITATKHENISKYIGQDLLPKQKIGLMFQGRMEFGPRALGNRSIICSAENKLCERIRTTIKKRPSFQPFCPTILHEKQKDYVHNNKNLDCSFMILTRQAKQKMIDDAPASVFIDKSARIQSLKKTINPNYYSMLSAYHKQTGIPVIINTSFNRSGEPIVETPEQALLNFKKYGLDFIAIGDYIVER